MAESEGFVDLEAAELVVAGLGESEADEALAARLMADEAGKGLIAEAWGALRRGDAASAKRLRGEIRDLPALKRPRESAAEATLEGDLPVWGTRALTMNLVGLGDELDLFRKLLPAPLTAAELAASAGCDARYVQEWCLNMAAAKILSAGEDSRFAVTPYARDCVSDRAKLNMAYNAPAAIGMRGRLVEAFRTGEGYGWGEVDQRISCGTYYFFKPVYETHLVPTLPEEVRAKLEVGGRLADVGCGQGVSCMVLASAFPKVQVTGYDLHGPSVLEARRLAEGKGLKNVDFVEVNSSDFGQPSEFDVVTFFDCFHDMSTATLAAQRAHACLKPGGVVYLIELLAAENDCIHEQLKLPTLQTFSGFSCHVCLPCGKCNGGDALGTVVPTCKHRDIFVRKAGFKELRTLDTPLNKMGFRALLAVK